MWLWQQKSMQKRHLLWAKLLLISFSFHFVFFVWLFFLHYDPSFDVAITVHSRLFEQGGASVVFVPLKPKGTVRAGSVVGTPQRPSPTVGQKKQKTSIQQTKKNKRKVEASKKIKKQTNNVVAMQNKPMKTQNKMVHNRIADVDVVRNSNQDVVQVNYREVEAHRRQVLLQEELAKCWKPPIGVPCDCVCQIKVVVSWNGIVKELDVAKSSGVLMYDVAARSALHTMKMPAWSKGKSLTITFKQ